MIDDGSRGLVLVVARQLVRSGARHAICAREERELGRARDNLAALGGEVLDVTCDVRIPAAAERLLETVVAHYGRLDVLINNAGIIEVGPARTMSLQDYRSVRGVNVWGAVHTTLAALPHLRRSVLARI